MSVVAYTWMGQGRLDEALDLQRRLVELGRQVRGQDHPDTVSYVSNLRRWESKAADSSS